MFTSLIVKASTPLLTPCFLRRLFDPTPNYINWEEEYKGRKKRENWTHQKGINKLTASIISAFIRIL